MAGPDRQKAAGLLRSSVCQGTATLGQIAEQAVGRLLERPDRGQGATELFTEEERKQLEEVLAATIGTSELLGRAKVHQQRQQIGKQAAQARAEKFADEWLTIGGHEEEGKGEHVGGRKALIDTETGEIKGGDVPRELHGTKIQDYQKNIRAHRKASKEPAEKPAEKPAKKAPYKVEAYPLPLPPSEKVPRVPEVRAAVAGLPQGQKKALTDLAEYLHHIAAEHHGAVPMSKVRQRLSHLPRHDQDALIQLARKQGLVSGMSHEGRHGVSDEERKAALREPGEQPIGYLSLRPQAKAAAPEKATAPPAARPAAVDPKQQDDADYEIGKAFRTKGEVAGLDGEADINILARNLTRAIPDLTPTEFKQFVLEAHKQRAIELHIVNEQQKISPEMRQWQIYKTKTSGDHKGDVVPLGLVMLKDKGKLQQVVKDFLAHRHSPQAAHAQHQVEPVPGEK